MQLTACSASTSCQYVLTKCCWRIKKVSAQEAVSHKDAKPSRKSIPVLAWPNTLFRKQLKKEENKHFKSMHNSQVTQLNLFVQAGVENKINVQHEIAMKTLGKCC